ncbi:MAG: hypothetical protein GF308_16280 [Candidatus Heimdallarchaeota archaeon]|nr:hypothetical protein [Candidatus Heimdallarchaeota archaeon]
MTRQSIIEAIKMSNILGLDIGGANTKFALIQKKEPPQEAEILLVGSDYFPFWKKHQEYPTYLEQLVAKLTGQGYSWEQVVFVTTAELADCFHTKKEGIGTICQYVLQAFTKEKDKMEPLILDINGKFIPATRAEKSWLEVSATNWIAAANYLGKKYPNSLLIDIGSTTTDLIPIRNGTIIAQGRTDLERLITSELVYSGLLRTNVAAIVQQVTLQGKMIPIASELFATTGDIYLLLGDITEEEFTVETADGKPATVEHAKARLARIVCADINQLTTEEIMQIAKQIRKRQLTQISQAFNKILTDYRNRYSLNPTIILTGAGAKSLGIALLRENGIYEQQLLDESLGKKESIALPAVAVAALFQRESKKEG